MQCTLSLYRKRAGNTINETQEIFVASGEIPFNVYEEAGKRPCSATQRVPRETLAFLKLTGYTDKKRKRMDGVGERF
jgi:hypothetical protein